MVCRGSATSVEKCSSQRSHSARRSLSRCAVLGRSSWRRRKSQASVGVAPVAVADSDHVVGRWSAIDGATGETKSLVEFYREGDELLGKIVGLFPKPGESTNPVCRKCPGKRKDKRIQGMVIISGLRKHEDKWVGGELLDPDSGNIYPCEIWLEEGRLKVRGYVFLFYRTQTWLRVGGQ